MFNFLNRHLLKISSITSDHALARAFSSHMWDKHHKIVVPFRGNLYFKEWGWESEDLVFGEYLDFIES